MKKQIFSAITSCALAASMLVGGVVCTNAAVIDSDGATNDQAVGSVIDSDENAVSSSSFSVSAKSNYFPTATVTTVSKDVICVEYQLSSSMDLVNAEWELTYNPAKLQLNTSLSKDYMPNITGEVVNTRSGVINGNYTDVSNLYDFSSTKTLVKAYFTVVGTSSATVNLDVKTLSVGYYDAQNKANFQPVVKNSTVQSSITSIPGYKSLKINKNTKAYKHSTPVTTQAVTAKSNYFPDAKVTVVNKDTICVEYQLKSTMKLVNSEWELTYNPAKLQLDAANAINCMPNISNETVKTGSGIIKGNFAYENTLKDFTTNNTFVKVYFKVLGSSSATVNLKVNKLGVGYMSNNKLVGRVAVEDGVEKNLTSYKGFENLNITRTTKAYKSTIPAAGQIITAKSNYFPEAKVTAVNNDTICVEYQLKSTMKLVNSEWELTYNPSKLKLDTTRTKDYMPNITNETVNTGSGIIKGNFAYGNTLKDFSTNKTFIKVYFKVLGNSNATVNLKVNKLGVGYMSNNKLVGRVAVEDGVVKNLTSYAGFEKLAITRATKATKVA